MAHPMRGRGCRLRVATSALPRSAIEDVALWCWLSDLRHFLADRHYLAQYAVGCSTPTATPTQLETSVNTGERESREFGLGKRFYPTMVNERKPPRPD
jgi:hypothetical protein